MKIKLSSMLVFILASAFLAYPARATPPESLIIHADLYLTGENSAAGSFDTSGLFSITGNASEVFFISDDTIHGVKTLVSSAGTITINFQAQLTWTSQTSAVAQGRYVIISGTGAYEKLHGVGDTYAELDMTTYHLIATYTGTGHVD